MISTEEALSIVLESCPQPIFEIQPSFECLGRTLGEDILTDRPFPPFDRVMMDGIAIRFEDFDAGNRKFSKEGICFAGDPQMSLMNKNACLEVMTGSVIPLNADVVVPYEQIIEKGDFWEVDRDNVKSFQNIHREGSDYEKNAIAIPKGKKIGTPEIAILASVGKTQIKVSKRPKVCIISTGNELVEPNQSVKPHQIRSSNKYQLKYILQQIGIDAELLHLNDSLKELTEKLKEIITEYDVIVTSGGVSKGKKDYLPEAFDTLKIEKKFHKVMQRPGKPFWYGCNEDTFVFALPGNPVSTAICAYKYLIPFVHRYMYTESERRYATLNEKVEFTPALTLFLPVKIEANAQGTMNCFPQKGNGSGDLINLSLADGFIELESKRNTFVPGEVFPYFPWKI